MKGPIQSVEVTYLVHATEDPGKLEAAVMSLFSASRTPELERLEGHFGNEILKARLHLTGQEAVKAFNSMTASMSKGLKKQVVDGLGESVDEHSALFLRFDKQRVVSGSLTLGVGDSIRVKVKPRIYLVKGGAIGFYSQLFEAD